MGLYNLTNVPTEASGLEIKEIINGENIKIVCAAKHAAPDDWLMMTSTYVGDHMFKMPDEMRKMYASDIISAIRMARRAGYNQAKAEIRAALGIPRA